MRRAASAHARVCDHAGSSRHSRSARPCVWPSTFGTVSAPGMIGLSRFNGWPVRLGADVDRYSFTVRDSHPLLLAGLPAHSENLHSTRLSGQLNPRQRLPKRLRRNFNVLGGRDDENFPLFSLFPAPALGIVGNVGNVLARVYRGIGSKFQSWSSSLLLHVRWWFEPKRDEC